MVGAGGLVFRQISVCCCLVRELVGSRLIVIEYNYNGDDCVPLFSH